jgi:hypothetical protein
MTKPVYALYTPGNPHPQVFTDLGDVPEGVEVWFYPEPDFPVPGVRFGNRFWPLSPTGEVRWEITWEEPALFKWAGVRGDRFSVAYYPGEERLLYEIYRGHALKYQKEIRGPNARYMAAEILGGVRERPNTKV